MRIGLLVLPLLVVALVLSTATAVRGTPQRGAPERGVLYVNYGPPPHNLDELWDISQLVVRGAVEASQVRRATPSGPPSVVTDHRVRVLEVLKNSLGRTTNLQVIHVLQSAGSMTVDGKEITVDPGSMPVLAPKQEVVVFLTEWAKGGGFAISSGPSGLYVLDDAVLKIPSFMKPAFADEGTVTKSRFLSTLRNRAVKK